MHSRVPLFVFLFTVVLFVVPLAAHAGGIPFFGPIIDKSWSVCPLSWGALITVVNNIISFAITIAIVFIAPIMIAYAGFLYVVNPVNASGISKAKSILWQTVIGIVIALAGWLIVDAIMAVLYNKNATVPGTTTTLGVWSQLITGNPNDTCLQQVGALPTDTLNQADTNAIAVVPTAPLAPARDEQTTRNRFKAAGVDINHDPCPAGSNGQGCTNVADMNEATIQQIIALAKAIGSTVNNKYVYITGGTEPGHAAGINSHANGFKVDLALNSVLNSYIINNNLYYQGQRMGDGPPQDSYTDRCGQNKVVLQNQYVKESNHWDITIYAVCDPLQ